MLAIARQLCNSEASFEAPNAAEFQRKRKVRERRRCQELHPVHARDSVPVTQPRRERRTFFGREGRDACGSATLRRFASLGVTARYWSSSPKIFAIILGCKAFSRM
jgi:hypothetical protein